MTQTCKLEEKTRIAFEGRLDTVTCMKIESDIRAAVENGEREVEFDLTAVEFVSSSFLRLCILAQQSAGSGRFQVVNMNPTIKRVFKIAGLDMMVRED